MADEIDKELSKKALGQIFPKPSGRRAPGSPMRGEERRATTPRRQSTVERRDWMTRAEPAAGEPRGRRGLEHQAVGRRSTDVDPRQFGRDERVAGTAGSSGGAAAERTKIYTAPVVRPKASTIGSAEGILSKASKRPGKLGMLARAAAALGGAYAAYKAWSND